MTTSARRASVFAASVLVALAVLTLLAGADARPAAAASADDEQALACESSSSSGCSWWPSS
jgi:hypothetical protein